MKFNRRQFVASVSAATAALAMPTFIFASRPDEYVEAQTAYGRIKGARKNGVNILILPPGIFCHFWHDSVTIFQFFPPIAFYYYKALCYTHTATHI